jgi:dnd system-associated protein 4
MRRINHSNAGRVILQSFAEASAEKKIFQQNWEIQLFAVALGFAKKKSESLRDVNTGGGIDFDTFKASGVWPGFINSLSLVEEETPDVLCSDEDRDEYRVELFEKYAEGGFSQMAADGVQEMDVISFADYVIKLAEKPPEVSPSQT